jgi:putative endonuclease
MHPPRRLTVTAPVRLLSTRELGALGESLVADDLTAQGWQVIDRNVRFPSGELDLIALEGTTLVFCEVKTRRSLLTGTPQEAVTPNKLVRLRRLAGQYLQGGSCELEHLRGVS